MKILWVTSGALPEANALMGGPMSPAGSWLVGMAAYLSNADGVELSIAFPASDTAPSLTRGERISHYGVKFGGTGEQFTTLLRQVGPDVVHIFGTEYAASLDAMRACKALRVRTVVSMQGLLSFISEHYLAGIPPHVQLGVSVRDVLRRDSPRQQQRKMAGRAVAEREVLRQADFVIGRTTWDRACLEQIYDGADYRTCNESLRPAFYGHHWELERTEEHRIFVSQGYYPIKGLHWLLRAMPTIVARFPKTRIAVAGPNPLRGKGWIQPIRRSSYDHYLAKLMRSNELEERVSFLGPLSELDIREAYLQSHVFVLPSSIENSSNSLGEAMLLGVPSIASYVGGTPDFIEHGVDGLLYQADAPYLLANLIMRVFADDALARTLSQRARARALRVYDRDINCRALLSVYSEVSGV